MSDRYDADYRHGQATYEAGKAAARNPQLLEDGAERKAEILASNAAVVAKMRAAEAEHAEHAKQAKYLLWLDTYNAALTGLLSALVKGREVDSLHEEATKLANRLHGEQS